MDKNKNSFGIPREWFSEPFDVVLKGSSSYNGTAIWKLLEYDDEGDSYVYVDDRITLYEPSTPGEHTYIFAKIAANIWSSDHLNDYYVGWRGTNVGDFVDSLCIRVVSKSSEQRYHGTLLTIGCIDGMAELFLNSMAEAPPFLALSNLFLVSTITDEVIANTFQYIGSRDEKWLQQNMK